MHGYKSLGRKVTDASNLGEGWRCQVRVKCDVLTLLVYKVVGKFLELPSSQHFIKAPYQFTRWINIRCPFYAWSLSMLYNLSNSLLRRILWAKGSFCSQCIQFRKLKLEEVLFAQSHSALKQPDWGLSPGLLSPEAVSSMTLPCILARELGTVKYTLRKCVKT